MKDYARDFNAIVREYERKVMATERHGGMVLGALYAFPAGFLFALWVMS